MFSQMMLDFGEKPNIIRDLSAYAGRRKQEIGADRVFDFSIGSPNVPPPPEVHKLMEQLLREEDPVALHSYTPASGLPQVRQAIAESCNRRFGDFLEPDGVFVTAGASGAIAMALKGLTVPGDEVIIFTPHYMEYFIYTEAYGAVPVVVETEPGSFQIDPARFSQALTERTKVVIINSPNNPSGVVYDRACLTAVVRILKEKSAAYGHPIFLLSDEPYRELVYDGTEVPCLMDLYPNTLVCYSYSKTLSIPGERMGYLAVSKHCAMYDRVLAACSGGARALGHICASNLYQRLIAKCTDVIADVDYYRQNRDILLEGLEKLGFSCVRPQGAFYLFMKCPTADSMEFCKMAMEHELILVPGHDFGVPDYLRISYCVDRDTVIRSLEAFADLAKQLLSAF